MKTKILTALLVASLFASCDKSESVTTESSSAVSFSSGIATRAEGDIWEGDDAIGVSMFLSGETAIFDNSLNAMYTIEAGAGSTAATFTSTDPLYYPTSGMVDFVAYYPYSTLADGAVTINTAAQTTEDEIKSVDYMVARTASYLEGSDDLPSLSFTRVMSKIILNLVRLDNADEAVVSDFTLSDIVTNGTLTIANSDLSVAASGSSSVISLFNSNDVVEMIIIPQTLSSAKLSLSIDGTNFVATISGKFDAGYRYTYTMEIGANFISLGDSTITDWDNTDQDEGLEIVGFN